jgi:hypothetical protein
VNKNFLIAASIILLTIIIILFFILIKYILKDKYVNSSNSSQNNKYNISEFNIEKIAFNFYKNNNIKSSPWFGSTEIMDINYISNLLTYQNDFYIACFQKTNDYRNNFSHDFIKNYLNSFSGEKICTQVNWINHFLGIIITKENDQIASIRISDSFGENSNYSTQLANTLKEYKIKFEHDQDAAIQKHTYECGPFSIYNTHKKLFNDIGINHKDIKNNKSSYELFNSRAHIACFLFSEMNSLIENKDNIMNNQNQLKQLCKTTIQNLENHAIKTQENFDNEIENFRQNLKFPTANVFYDEAINQNSQALG